MTETSTLNLPVFYTCTAATPDGPPLEIAWGSLALETYGVMCGSHLVRPPAAWISELARDAAALQPYGLALSDLRQFGTPPHEIAAHMNEALTERELFSVVPEDDARIRRIFDAAKMAPGFRAAYYRRRRADRRTRAVATSIAHRDSPRPARSGGHVSDQHPRRSEGALSRDLLGLRRLAELAARLAGQAPTPTHHQAKPRRTRRVVDGAGALTSINLRRLFPCPVNKPKSSRRPC